VCPKILSSSKALSEFILALHLSPSKPQMRHVVDVADSLIVCESYQTLSALNRQLLEPKDVYALSVFPSRRMTIMQNLNLAHSLRK